jgi:hypothetical protein
MLHLPPADPARPDEAFSLSLLADLARLLPAADPAIPAVRAVVHQGESEDLGRLRARSFGIEAGDGEVRLPRALLAMVLDLAGGAAEQGVTEADRYGRVPSSRNPLAAAGLEREPVVAAAAARLRQAAVKAAGRRPIALLAPWPGGRRWAAAFTHDLDVVDYWPAFTALRLVELLRGGHPGRAGRVAAAALRSVAGDPVGDGVRHVLATERRLGIASTWFVLCGDPTLTTMRAGDLTYRPEGRRASRIVRTIADTGHEVGLHGSFATMTDPRAFAAERARLEKLSGLPVAGVRQHFLRLRPGVTHAAMAAAGFTYDATYGFPDRNGFRLGIGDCVPGWDHRSRKASGLEEAPLLWMDRAASKYRGIEDPDAWVNDALELAGLCRRDEAAWVGLWHPNLTAPLGFPRAEQAFVRLAEAVLAQEPYVAPLRDLVAWRRARRAARACGVLPDGTVAVEASADVALEDADGRPLRAVRA